MHERGRHLPPVVTGAILIALLLGIVGVVSPAYAMNPDSTPEAQFAITQTDNTEPSGSDAQPSQVDSNCAGIAGAVMNWGYQNEPGVTLAMNGDTYYLSQISTSDGEYGFRGLGQGYAVLSPALTGAQAELHIYTDKVAVPLQCERPVVLNLGVYSGETGPRPPAYLSVTAKDTKANPGDTVQFDVVARNELPTAISHVVITDLFPTPLKITAAKATRGETAIADKRMLSVYVGDMESGETVTATVRAQIDRWTLRGEKLENRITLMYAESMADQVVSTVTVGKGVSVPPARISEEPALLAMAKTDDAGASPEDAAKQATSSGDQAADVASPITIFAIGGKDNQPDSAGGVASRSSGDTPLIGNRLPATGIAFDLVTLSLIAVGLLAIAVVAQFVRGRTS